MRHNLYMFRNERHLTRSAMAKILGVHRSTYTAIENGERDGRKSFWNELQKSFNIADAMMWELMKKEDVSNVESKQAEN